jgi:hypothetical protein
MDFIDFEDKELAVTKAVGLAFHSFDLVVRAFQRTSGDGIIVVSHKTMRVESERAGELTQ